MVEQITHIPEAIGPSEKTKGLPSARSERQLPSAALKFEDEHYDVGIPCICARHPPESQKAPPAKDAVRTSTFGLSAALVNASPEDVAEERCWGRSFNASGMWMNNQGQGQDNGDASEP